MQSEKVPQFFRVETCVDGKWQPFTTRPLIGQEEAEAKLKEVHDFAKSVGHTEDEVRLVEMDNLAITRSLVRDEREALFDFLTSSIPPEEIRRMVVDLLGLRALNPSERDTLLASIASGTPPEQFRDRVTQFLRDKV